MNIHTLCSNLTLFLVLVLTQKLPVWGWGYELVVEYLPSMYKALSLYPVTDNITSLHSFSPHSPLITAYPDGKVGFIFSFTRCLPEILGK